MASEISIITGVQNLLGLRATGGGTDIQTSKIKAAINAVREFAFGASDWGWAKQVATLERIQENSPYRDDWAIYRRPAGLTRVVAVFYGDYATDNVRAVEYERGADGIHAQDDSGLQMAFIVPLPIADWPEEFARYVEALAALEIVPRTRPDQAGVIANIRDERYSIAVGRDQQNYGTNQKLFDTSAITGARREYGTDNADYYDRGGY